jgi:purine-nucleoside phosphorylase
MTGNEDSLQPVKYLGKARTVYAHGMGVAIVSIYSIILFSFIE